MVSIRTLESSIVTLEAQLVIAKRYRKASQIFHIEDELLYVTERLNELQPTS